MFISSVDCPVRRGMDGAQSVLLSARNLPLIVLFASRRENELQMAFSARDMNGILKELQLDNDYQSQADI
ncbi:hypothetical protein HYPSUDRAFT_201383 [Hypholoma sublateritium FD-334 SS-4]|uniref:Uncharacterized protein n=1 Tax=Hypholoma sublateritium (strain FD-334 SS-4) TaxID=945553 RepID=A0A0D2MI70_HYPSF|nr:hypothetical protein HYPSUDRAFT_201383 [Hypholoma sublateritium FD-334 SS-4]